MQQELPPNIQEAARIIAAALSKGNPSNAQPHIGVGAPCSILQCGDSVIRRLHDSHGSDSPLRI